MFVSEPKRKEERLARRSERAATVAASLQAKDAPAVAGIDEKLVDAEETKSGTKSVVNSDDDSNLAYSASSDSDVLEDAVPPTKVAEASDSDEDDRIHSRWGDVGPSDISLDKPTERRAALTGKRKAP